MTDVSRLVQDAMTARIPGPEGLPADLQPVVALHVHNLTRLAASLAAAGQDRDMIRALVTGLVASYARDLLSAIEARQ